jgi:hypothetical protein
MLTGIFACLLALVPAQDGLAQPSRDIVNMTPEQLKAGIVKQHPAAYYILAEKLFEAGEKDEAVFWYYAGQLRGRFHLVSNPDLAPSGDPTLLGSLNSVVGPMINAYAFGDLPAMHAVIDKVLAWDKETPNEFTSKEKFEAGWNDTRSGMLELQKYLDDNAEDIRKQRAANGLPNRP